MEVAEATLPTVFIVTSVNWTMEVELNQFNLQFDAEKQVHEVAALAVEKIHNISLHPELKVVMNNDSKNESPQLGTVLLISIKGQNPENAVVVPSYLALADAGLYSLADKMKLEYDKQLAGIEAQKKKQTELSQKLKNSLENFDVLKLEMLGKKKKPANKKKK